MERDGKMRILVDTNILFSALVFPYSRPALALLYIADNHEIVLCDRNIAELRDILGRKAPKYLPDAEVEVTEKVVKCKICHNIFPILEIHTTTYCIGYFIKGLFQ